MNTIKQSMLQSELDKKAKLNDLEVFTSTQLNAYIGEARNEIAKSTDGKEELEKEVATELKSFKSITVWDDNTLEKSIQFVRMAQVKWDEPVGDDIQKSKSGTYLPTPENKKLGRVGQKYGNKESESESKGEDKFLLGMKPKYDDLHVGQIVAYKDKDGQYSLSGKIESKDDKENFIHVGGAAYTADELRIKESDYSKK